MRRIALVAVCALLGICQVSSAGVRQGQIEVGGWTSGSLGTTLGDGGGSTFEFDAMCGYFMAREVELKTTLFYKKTDGSDGAGGILAGVDYLWPSRGPWLPYAGGALGFSFGSGSDPLGNFHGGIRYFFSGALSADMEARYTFAWNHIGDGLLEAGVGLSVYFDHF